ncbi:M56 family metallopeptidase [Simkania sp.]|uniref:M56 family metallopeptidase n=1 Tax=Simkania sp. TaxID=34094 RepID=UPI003B51C447
MIARFILNIYASATLSFLFSIGIIFLFSRLKKPRLLACLFLIPFLKVIWDLFSAAHSNWVYLHNLSIFSAPENSRIISVYALYHGLPGCGIHLSLLGSTWFSVGDLLHESWPVLSYCLALTIVTISCLKLIRRIFLFFKRSSETSSCAVVGFWKPKIVSSEAYFKTLSTEEQTAVISHEKAHIRWGDHLVHHFLFFFEPLFWFLPFKKRLIHQLHLCQEMACDKAAKAPLAVASALKKALTTPSAPLTLNFSSPSTKRVQALLKQPSAKASLWQRSLSFILFGTVLTFILMSQFLPF